MDEHDYYFTSHPTVTAFLLRCFTILAAGFCAVHGGWVVPNGLNTPVRAFRTIYVDRTGRSSNFTTIQSAIDDVPTGNNRWVVIRVGPGVYRYLISMFVCRFHVS